MLSFPDSCISLVCVDNMRIPRVCKVINLTNLIKAIKKRAEALYKIPPTIDFPPLAPLFRVPLGLNPDAA